MQKNAGAVPDFHTVFEVQPVPVENTGLLILGKKGFTYGDVPPMHPPKFLQSCGIARRFPALCGGAAGGSKRWNFKESRIVKGLPELTESPQKWS